MGPVITTQTVAKPSLPLSNNRFEYAGYDQRLGLGVIKERVKKRKFSK
jgi:hypothetical protein